MSVNGGLIGVCFLPHGTMTLDPNRPDLPDGAAELHHHCMNISQRVADLHPDLIILSTPHGLCLHQAVSIYQPGIPNATADGNCEWKQEWTDFGVKVRIESDISQQLLIHLQEQFKKNQTDTRIRTEGLISFAGLSTPLRWGESVPLYLALRRLSQQYPVSASSVSTSASRYLDVSNIPAAPRIIIISQPRLGLTVADRSDYRIKQRSLLIQLGRDVRSFIESSLSTRRVVLIISGDLAHTHAWNANILPSVYQPDPSSFRVFPQSGLPEAALYDTAIGDWIQGREKLAKNDAANTADITNRDYTLNESGIVRIAGSYEEIALSCGYSGMLMMQGVMEGELIRSGSDSEDSTGDVWSLADYFLCHPCYYGMMTAIYTRRYGKSVG